MTGLEHATRIAEEAHEGQLDKAGAPYVTHPLRVAASLHGEEAKIVAMLHDVVEDGPGWSLERLRAEGFSASVVAAVEALTHREGEEYMHAVRRAKANPLARRVKLADLADNIERTKLKAVSHEGQSRLARYESARALLLEDE